MNDRQKILGPKIYNCLPKIGAHSCHGHTPNLTLP